MATEAEIQAAIDKAAARCGLSPGATSMLKAIRYAESSNRTDTGLPTNIKDEKTGKPASSAKGMWQFTTSTWKTTWSRLPADLQQEVPPTFTSDPYAQAIMASRLLQQHINSGYDKDPRLLYVAHWNPSVALATKKRMDSVSDFSEAFSLGLADAIADGKLQGGRFNNMSPQEKAQVATQEVGGALAKIQEAGAIKEGLKGYANMTGKRTNATDGSGAGMTFKAGDGDYQLVTQDMPLTSTSSAARYEPDVIIEEGLNLPGWHQNWAGGGKGGEVLVGNPKLVALPSRGTFSIWTQEHHASPLMTKFLTSSTGEDVPSPVEVRLNVSLKNLSVRSKHVINKKPTRTGFHLTFWGMEPDILTGQGSTGVFLNQFGLASVMSTSADTGMAESLASMVKWQYTNNVKIDVKIRADGITRIDKEHPDEKLVTSDMKESKRGFFTNLVTSNVSDLFGMGSNFAGDIDKDNVYSSDIAAWSDRKSRYGSGSLLGSFFPSVSNSAQSKFRNKYKIDARIKSLMGEKEDPFRVAAQDAFLELLQVFKNNGQIRFHNTKYDGEFNLKEQEGPQEWSEKTGLSAFQGKSRNNDVFARGVVLFRVKGTTYMGYFKSINFTMSAETPYTWDFDFTFQVVKTIKAGYVPETLFKKGVG